MVMMVVMVVMVMRLCPLTQATPTDAVINQSLECKNQINHRSREDRYKIGGFHLQFDSILDLVYLSSTVIAVSVASLKLSAVVMGSCLE